MSDHLLGSDSTKVQPFEFGYIHPTTMRVRMHVAAALMAALPAVALAVACGSGSSGVGGADAGRADVTSREGGAGVDALSHDGGGGGLSDSNPGDAFDAGPTRSIQDWTKCDGVTDDSLGAAVAFAEAAGGGFTLLVDCPVFIHVGTDISRPIFIDDDTSVLFSGKGLFITDSVLMPTFVLANTTNVTMTNWQVEYVGGIPVAYESVNTYEDGGTLLGTGDPAGYFNDTRLTPWLTAHRKIEFERADGVAVNSIWAGPTNGSALFFLIGSTSNVTVTGMSLYVPASAGGDKFIPMCFSMTRGYLSNQTVTPSTSITSSKYVATPSHLTFSNIELDGTYMGFQGGGQNLTFSNIHSKRYGDLQDSDGGTVGGVGKWFAPPHLFYLNYSETEDPALFNSNIEISNVMDEGERVGVARDTSSADLSGYALSLKIGGVNSSVDTYTSYRPDGLMDCLNSNGLKISNVTATYNSQFLNNLFPGLRFPSSPYVDVAFDNVKLTDLATTSTQAPMSSAGAPGNSDMTATRVTFTLKEWSGTGSLVPTIAGVGNDLTVDYVLTGAPAAIEARWKSPMSWQLEANPSTVTAGAATTLTWVAREATNCTAGGAWSGSGSVGTTGTKSVTLDTAGTQTLTLTCTGAGDGGAVSGEATVNVTVTP